MLYIQILYYYFILLNCQQWMLIYNQSLPFVKWTVLCQPFPLDLFVTRSDHIWNQRTELEKGKKGSLKPTSIVVMEVLKMSASSLIWRDGSILLTQTYLWNLFLAGSYEPSKVVDLRADLHWLHIEHQITFNNFWLSCDISMTAETLTRWTVLIQTATTVINIIFIVVI